jgi:methylmalonyl-CoA mutase, N-terminal domain
VARKDRQTMTDEYPIDSSGAGSLEAARRKWEEEILNPALRRVPERRDSFATTSGIDRERLYEPGDVEEIEYTRDLGFPGEPPFTRGVQPTMYRGRFWTMRQYAGYASAEESNRRYRYLLSQGQSGLSVAFDLPTQIGYDSDSPEAEGEVGKVGVAISTLDDMVRLFDEIPLDSVSVSMTINATAAIIMAMFVATARRQGVDPAKLTGTIQNDILKEYIARGTYRFPPGPSLRLVVDLIEYCQTHVPKWNTISISGYHIREAGSTAAQELAFTLADGLTYVSACLQRGLPVDSFAPRLSFFFNAHNDFFEEIAKFRAARRLWARLMQTRFGAKDPRSWMLRFHTQTAGCSLTAQQPENNIVRTTLQALAAVLGGTQSLHTNALDEALALPSEKAARIALRTQQVIAHESGVADVVDPLGGSYYLESLTHQLEQRAQDYLDQIDQRGGVLACIDNGFLQREIHDAATRHQEEIDRQERIVVGVNEYVADEEPLPTLRISPESEQQHVERLARVRRERDGDLCRRRLEELRQAASGNQNLMPAIMNAVRAYATLGEMVGVLREVFGEYTETPVV